MAAMKHLLMEVEDLWDKGYSLFEISDILNVDEDLVEDCLDVLDATRYPEVVVWH